MSEKLIIKNGVEQHEKTVQRRRYGGTGAGLIANLLGFRYELIVV
jgi:hypothetical protein